ncbi:hypothetical protein Pyn_22863 [Prunus yedoensis var. nudiflora]|uniref:Uncharacterized protein n=1 Tax=Prunus yedoensis var. nudiflora TaxID=2094558 RepID=A0A314YHW1_PRUYE|nr:hypothetical protein Pyn_22863 [Prunus yedoensis var. nudiflora]
MIQDIGIASWLMLVSGNMKQMQYSVYQWDMYYKTRTGWSGIMRKTVATQYEVDIGLLVQFEIAEMERWGHLAATLRTFG